MNKYNVVLFPPLRVGDRVVRGPDWQWGAQGNNEEGTVVHIKDWKGTTDCGVSILWDNGEKNMYRYGADNCYDVMDAYPMRRQDYQPIYGLIDSAESIVDYVIFIDSVLVSLCQSLHQRRIIQVKGFFCTSFDRC